MGEIFICSGSASPASILQNKLQGLSFILVSGFFNCVVANLTAYVSKFSIFTCSFVSHSTTIGIWIKCVMSLDAV